MTGTAAPPVDRRSADRVAWLWVAAAAAAWVAAYVLNRPLWDRLVFDVAGLDAGTHLGDGVHFFLYDSVKIALLLGGIVFVVAVLRTFVSVERTRELLGGRRQAAGYLLAAVLGVATPFCSCAAVPVFIGFVAAGVPLGITMTFLIASPLVNEVGVVLVGGSFGWDVAALYVATGLAIAVGAGVVIGRLGLEHWVEPFVYETTVGAAPGAARPTWAERFRIARSEVVAILRRIWPFLLAGIAVGAAIHGWAPEDFFAAHAGSDDPWAVPVAVVLGIPLYSNAAGAIPLVEAMHAKGVALGTSLAFMMSVVALSLPEMVLLRRVLRPRLLAAFVGVVGAGILAVGFLFNAIL
ncbi:MAG: permease [Actinobacteria bacterium]|nr:permease [Actinomycetota bacterium]